MIARKSSTLRVVLYEGRDSRPLPAELRLELTQTLLDCGRQSAAAQAQGSRFSAKGIDDVPRGAAQPVMQSQKRARLYAGGAVGHRCPDKLPLL